MADSSAAKMISRQPQRYDVEINATFRAVGSVDWANAELVNLSFGGLCMRSSAPLTKDQVLEFIVETVDAQKNRHRRRVVARVVWKRDGRYGVQFLQSTRKRATRR